MAYIIKDEISGSYMTPQKVLNEDRNKAGQYADLQNASYDAARMQDVYDYWQENNSVVTGRGYVNAFKPITPKPLFVVERF